MLIELRASERMHQGLMSNVLTNHLLNRSLCASGVESVGEKKMIISI